MEDIEALIADLITDNEALKVLVKDMPDTLHIDDQHRLYAVKSILDCQREKLHALSDTIELK